MDTLTVGLGLVAAHLVFWLRVNWAWLVLAGALVGLPVRILG